MNYTVENNDTLYSIANKFGVSTLDIINSNNLSSYFLTPGTTLIIPNSDDSVFLDYSVKSGDSLYSIAAQYNIEPSFLAEINGLRLYDYIYPNQIIVVPKNNAKLYITKEGDNLRNLLEVEGFSLWDIDGFNRNLYLLPGQLVIGVKNNRK